MFSFMSYTEWTVVALASVSLLLQLWLNTVDYKCPRLAEMSLGYLRCLLLQCPLHLVQYGSKFLSVQLCRTEHLPAIIFIFPDQWHHHLPTQQGQVMQSSHTVLQKGLIYKAWALDNGAAIQTFDGSFCFWVTLRPLIMLCQCGMKVKSNFFSFFFCGFKRTAWSEASLSVHVHKCSTSWLF